MMEGWCDGAAAAVLTQPVWYCLTFGLVYPPLRQTGRRGGRAAKVDPPYAPSMPGTVSPSYLHGTP